MAGLELRGNCSSVFIASTPDWMAEAEGNSGKIVCPKCKSRVGSYKWSGATCSCGKWITPAFQFQLSRVDPKYLFKTVEGIKYGVHGHAETAPAKE